MAKHDDDNRSNQLNQNNDAYWSSRGYSDDDDDDDTQEFLDNIYSTSKRASGRDCVKIIDFGTTKVDCYRTVDETIDVVVLSGADINKIIFDIKDNVIIKNNNYKNVDLDSMVDGNYEVIAKELEKNGYHAFKNNTIIIGEHRMPYVTFPRD